MYQIKNSIFLELTKNQKADFLSFVKIYTKNYIACDDESIFYNLLEELDYLKTLGQGKFEFINVNNETHLCDIKKYIKACKKYYEHKAAQRPFYEEQKRIQKEIRAKIRDEKQKKEPPTKKQISYYKSLCKRHGEAPQNINELSKYSIKKEIQRLLDTQNNNGTE